VARTICPIASRGSANDLKIWFLLVFSPRSRTVAHIIRGVSLSFFSAAQFNKCRRQRGAQAGTHERAGAPLTCSLSLPLSLLAMLGKAYRAKVKLAWFRPTGYEIRRFGRVRLIISARKLIEPSLPLSVTAPPLRREIAKAPIGSEPQLAASVAHGNRETLNQAHAAIFKQHELRAKLEAIDNEMRAIDAYEAVKSGKIGRGRCGEGGSGPRPSAAGAGAEDQTKCGLRRFRESEAPGLRSRPVSSWAPCTW